jgi:hypothetical protein
MSNKQKLASTGPLTASSGGGLTAAARAQLAALPSPAVIAADKAKIDAATQNSFNALDAIVSAYNAGTLGGSVLVANDFDPTVSGLAAKAGTVAATEDGMKAWTHGVPVTSATVPDTNWEPIG